MGGLTGLSGIMANDKDRMSFYEALWTKYDEQERRRSISSRGSIYVPRYDPRNRLNSESTLGPRHVFNGSSSNMGLSNTSEFVVVTYGNGTPRRLAQRHLSKHRDSPVMTRLLDEIIDAQ